MSRRGSPRLSLAAALLLPLAASAVIWGTTRHQAQRGEEWLVPIVGYDPRDLLRGHFVQYRYDWPVDEDQRRQGGDPAHASRLCIEGTVPEIRRVRPLPAGEDRQECAIVVRATLGARREVRGLESGIFFASQSRAAELSRRLADPSLQARVRVRIRPDGVMRPVDIEFRRRRVA